MRNNSGVHLADLLFIEEGNPDYLKSVNKAIPIINFSKHRLTFELLFEVIEKRQQTPYTFVVQRSIQSFLVQQYRRCQWQEKQMFELSLQREPRSASRSDIK
ncbi:Protein son of sevenless [Balamuthia mandrillaris]